MTSSQFCVNPLTFVIRLFDAQRKRQDARDVLEQMGTVAYGNWFIRGQKEVKPDESCFMFFGASVADLIYESLAIQQVTLTDEMEFDLDDELEERFLSKVIDKVMEVFEIQHISIANYRGATNTTILRELALIAETRLPQSNSSHALGFTHAQAGQIKFWNTVAEALAEQIDRIAEEMIKRDIRTAVVPRDLYP